MADEITSPEGGSETTTTEADTAKTFTQDELNRIVNERVNKSKAQFKDYPDLKAAAEKLATLEAEGQTETQKLRTAAEKAQQESAQHKAALDTATNTIRETRVEAAVLLEAAKQGATDPGDVFKLLDGASVEIDETGKVTGADKAVADLLKSKPHLAAHVAPGGFGGGVQGAVSAPDSKAAFNEQLRREAGFAAR
jgi:hypothetical protein